jgi:peroxiredoxin Q/BCP
VAYFAASVDTPEDNKRFAESLGLDFPILSDPGKQVAAAYGVVTPERQFAQRWTYYIGVDGKILFIDKKVSTSTAGQDLAAKLGELGIAKKQ